MQMAKRVIFIIVKCSTDDEWLNSKMLQITRSSQEHLVNGRYPTVVLDDYSQINSYLNKADYLFVQTAGDYILDFDHIWNKLHSIPEDVGLISHITWNVNSYTPFMEEQCFIINTKAIRNLDFSSSINTGRKFIRSKEDLHDGHAPLWVDLSTEQEVTHGKFGTKVMYEIIRNGYKVRNFDLSWRYADTSKIPVLDLGRLPTRGYFYPKIATKVFSQCLKDLTVNTMLDEAQSMAITVINKILKFDYINALYWDDIVKSKFDTVIAPANGLIAETLAYFNGAKKIIIYDINPSNIEFKKYLYDNFDGRDYEKFYTDYARQRNLGIEPNDVIIENLGEHIKSDNREVLAHWDEIKKIEKEFVLGDLYDTLPQIIEHIDSKTLIHTSTILGFYIFSNILHDQNEIDLAVKTLTKKVKDTGALWLGER
jgi:hypothetical protein